MKRSYLFIVVLVLLSGCGRLDTIPYSPLQTGETWLQHQPYAEVSLASMDFILVQPSSTFFVYFLGLLTIGIGLYFFKTKENHKTRLWWGIALLCWGLGAVLAGTSYQAFSYEIKCVGFEHCRWTSWWEVLYMILSVASVNAMMAALAYSSAEGKTRRWMFTYAIANFGVYLLITLIGVFVPVKFLISFELLLLFLAPSIVFFLLLNLRNYRRQKNQMDLTLVRIWLWLGFTIAIYFICLMLGITEYFWEQGVWFSENDVLHIGLIVWMILIALGLGRKIADRQAIE